MSHLVHGTAHQSEADVRLSVLRDKSRDNGMKRTLVWLVPVHVRRINHEHLTPVLKNKTKLTRGHT